ncbi:glycosyltransferase family 10 domain-containing protein [Shimia biformata]|uniref:glycosyltransferase family 10 domain-containing protein n=1 Tax=Shimia biformata TaxID=1294299 RepID=UPI001950CA43|nr:glycosyltransferase family 10 [Shimia biformata]
MIRVFRIGLHSHRTPLSYPALAPLWEGQIKYVGQPARADLYLFSHVPDIQEAPRALVEDWRRRRVPVVLMSEEPFWDTIWGRRPMDRLIHVPTDWGDLPVIQLNHQTSDIFRFDRIPYYLLTNHRFANAYRFRFARNARQSARDWKAAFAARRMALTLMFERRPEPWHDVSWPEGDLVGLCAWRTRLAEACLTPDTRAETGAETEVLGHSWQGGTRRFDLPDWHLDKLTRLDGRTRMMGAIENTHQPDYVTEKFFDAFACGAVPLYVASPQHRVHGFGLPEEAWINLHGLDPSEAAARLRGWQPDSATFDAYATAQARLSALFGDSAAWIAERRRLARAVPDALTGVLDAARAA